MIIDGLAWPIAQASLAARLAQASRLAYTPDPADLGRELARLGFVLQQHYDVQGTRAYLAVGSVAGARQGPPDRARPDLLIGYQGTTRNWWQILDDIDARPHHPAELGGVMVDTGFWCGVDRIFAELLQDLRERGPELARDGAGGGAGSARLPVWLAGHSLGGAFATVTAARLIAAGIQVAGLVTFGSPRAGGAGLGELLRPIPAFWRVVHCADIVPLVPTLGLGYRHAGRFVYLDRLGVAQIAPPLFAAGVDRLLSVAGRLAQDLGRGECNPWHAPQFVDHRIAGYEAALARAGGIPAAALPQLGPVPQAPKA